MKHYNDEKNKVFIHHVFTVLCDYDAYNIFNFNPYDLNNGLTDGTHHFPLIFLIHVHIVTQWLRWHEASKLTWFPCMGSSIFACDLSISSLPDPEDHDYVKYYDHDWLIDWLIACCTFTFIPPPLFPWCNKAWGQWFPPPCSYPLQSNLFPSSNEGKERSTSKKKKRCGTCLTTSGAHPWLGFSYHCSQNLELASSFQKQ